MRFINSFTDAKRRFRPVGPVLLIWLLLPVYLFGVTPTAADGEDSIFRMTMLDVGQGLSVLLESDGEYALYDGGGRASSSYVVSYLKQHSVERLNYMIASHYDEDHIAGLVGVLHTTEVNTILCPAYTTDTEIFASFENAAESSGAVVIHPEAGDIYTFGSSELLIAGPLSYEAESENNRSIVVCAGTGESRILLMGDAEFGEEEELCGEGRIPESEILVVGHHGSAYSTGSALLDAASPKYALISAGADNDYGHPAERTLEELRSRGIEMYRTDLQGEIQCIAAGGQCIFTTEYAEGQKPGTEQSRESEDLRETEAEGTDEQTYVLNTNTKKFHLPGCVSVAQIKDKNREDYTGTREDLTAGGYEPCKRCYP